MQPVPCRLSSVKVDGALVPLGGHRVVGVAAGPCNTVVCTADGKLFTCGQGLHAQLGHHTEFAAVPTHVDCWSHGYNQPLTKERVRCAVAGQRHLVVCTENGRVFTCGSEDDGRLGHGEIEEWDIYTDAD